MPTIVPDDELKTVLKDLSAPGADAAKIVTAGRVRSLACALEPTSPTESQSLGLLCLSKIVDVCERAGGSKDEQATRIKSVFDPLVADAAASLAAASQDPGLLVPATTLLAALAPLSPAGTVALLTQPLGIDKTGKDADLDPLALLLEFAELPSPLQPALAALLSGLAGTKTGREVVRDRALEWVSAAAENGKGVEGDTQVLCSVALSKLGREEPVIGEKDEERQAKEEASEETEAGLARTLAKHVVASASDPSASAILPTLEGLSVLSTRPFIRDILADDIKFLKALLSLSPVPQAVGGSLPVTPRSSMVSLDETATAPVSTALCYGISTILSNLSMRKPVLSEHDEQMARLRRMAIAGKQVPDRVDPHESNEAAAARTKKLVAAGVVSALRGLVRAESTRVRESLGRLCVDLVEDKDLRAPFIRDGGVRVLMTVLRDLKDTDDKLPAAQALAKLTISTPPQLLFQPPFQTNALNALGPMYLLLTHPKSSLLQKFEALMALTNLASIDPQFGARIVDAKVTPPVVESEFRGAGRTSEPVAVIARVEELMLDDNTLVRRAATELVCNLVTAESGYRYFSGEATHQEGQKDTRAATRLGVLLLLSDVDDMPTRLAASGALAVLTESPVACAALLSGGGITTSRKRTPWQRIGDLFAPGGTLAGADEEEEGGGKIETISNLPPDAGLAHRGAVIVTNLAQYAREEDEEELKKGKETLGATLLEAARALVPANTRPSPETMGVVQALVQAQKALA